MNSAAFVFVLAISQVFGSGKNAAVIKAKMSMLKELSDLTSKELKLCTDAVAATDVLLTAAKSSGDLVPFMVATAEACDDIPEAGADSIIEIVTEMYDALDLELMVGVEPDVDLAAQVALSWVDQNEKYQTKVSTSYIEEVKVFKAKYSDNADIQRAADAGIKSSNDYTAAVKKFNTDFKKSVADLKTAMAK